MNGTPESHLYFARAHTELARSYTHGIIRMRDALQRTSSPLNVKQPRMGEALKASASEAHDGGRAMIIRSSVQPIQPVLYFSDWDTKNPEHDCGDARTDLR